MVNIQLENWNDNNNNNSGIYTLVLLLCSPADNFLNKVILY